MRFALPGPPAALWTVGHSTLSIDEFVAVLKKQSIATLVDVRRHAGSRRYPHFNPDALRDSLAREGLDYQPMPALGGRRTMRADSPNVNWRNASFRGYADYMMTPAFASAAQALAELAIARPTAVMCAEALWWRCHRSLIADAFKAAGTTVWNIDTRGDATEHPYTGAARIVDGELNYGATSQLFG